MTFNSLCVVYKNSNWRGEWPDSWISSAMPLIGLVDSTPVGATLESVLSENEIPNIQEQINPTEEDRWHSNVGSE